jgi:Protein of unknown function (DUF1583) C domain
MNLIGVLLLLKGAASAQGAESHFYQDLRGHPLHPAAQLFGINAGRHAQVDSHGLRIRLPAKREKSGPVGVSFNFEVGGDFEVTAGYQIIRADRPPSGPGAGVNLRVIIGSPMTEAAGLARYVRADDGDLYLASWQSAVAGSKPRRAAKKFPTQAKSGKLRLRRAGSTIHFLVAEGSSNEFRELYQATFANDACTVRLAATTGNTPCMLDVRFLDLRVLADKLSNKPARKHHSAHWATLLALLSTGVIVLVLSFLAWRRWWRACA